MSAVKAAARSASGIPRRVGTRLCLAGAALGAVGLFGWVSGASALTAIVPGLPRMMPITAVALLVVGCAGAARQPGDAGSARKTLSLLGALVVLAVGAATLAGYALGIDLPVDRLVPRGQVTLAPARSSPPTALALTCLATALLLFDVRASARVRPSEWLVLCAAFIAFAGLTGITLGAAPLYRLTRAPAIGLSLPTAVSLLLTSMGLLLARPTAGVMGVATSPGPGGVLLRRLTLPAIMVPLLLGLVVTRLAADQSIANVSIPVAILTAAMTGVALLLLVITAGPLNRAHDALEASRMQTQHLVEQAPDGIFVADVDGRYTDVNDAGCRLLACSREEIVGKTIVDLIPPHDVERLRRAREGLLDGATDVDEWTLRRKDGREIPVEVSARILSDGRWQGFVRDISERKRLEGELRLAEARSSGILSVSADAIISIDPDQRITLFNEGAEKIYGYSRQEAIGARLDMLIPERLRSVHHQHVARFALGRRIAKKMGARDAVIVGLRKNGEEFPADAAISNIEVGGARVLTVVVRDITEQKRIENEHRFLADIGPVLATTLDYEETLSHIAEIATRGLSDFCMVDLVDEKHELRRLRVVSRDPAEAAICDVLQRTPLDRKRPRLIWSALESREPILVPRPTPADIEALAQNDDHRQALRAAGVRSVIVLPLVAHGRPLGAMSFLSASVSRIYGADDLRVAQEFAQRAALAVDSARLYRAAQRAIQMRDEVLGIVAHDLRNPVSVILMEAMLLEGGKAMSARRPSESAARIRRSANRMNRLIQDLLDVTRIEAGQLVIEQSRLSAAQLIAHVIDVHHTAAAARTIELRRSVPEEGADIWADRDRLLQVFDNLVGNAIKFTAPGGCVTVGAARREADVLFSVGDTGPGIAIEDQPRLFDRFWQAQRAGRHGAGLGLPIVKGIVEAHGGRVWVESVPGEGSTFLFTIPASQRVGGTPPFSPSQPAVIGANRPDDGSEKTPRKHPRAASFSTFSPPSPHAWSDPPKALCLHLGQT